jgi:phosphohistidine phosphatase
MKRLFLLRHARAATSGGEAGDVARTLMLSGIEDGALIARYIRKCDYRIDLILCSASARTAQTAALVAQEVPARIVQRDNLYLAEVPRLIAAVRGAPPPVANLMIVGHNRGIEDCAVALARAPLRPSRQTRYETLAETFPTGALAVLDFDVGRWRDVREGSGALIDFVRPDDL